MNAFSPDLLAATYGEGDGAFASEVWFRATLGDACDLEAAEAAACLPLPALDVLAGIAQGGDPEAVYDLGPGSWQAITSLCLVDIAHSAPQLTELGSRIARLALDALGLTDVKSYSSQTNRLDC